MQNRIELYRTQSKKVALLFETVPAEYRQQLQTELSPFIQEHLNGRAQGILQFFQRHCDIAELEQQLLAQASVLPEKEQAVFLKAARKTIHGLRSAANKPAHQVRASQSLQIEVRQEGEQVRKSVVVRLRTIQESKLKQAKPAKTRTAHQR